MRSACVSTKARRTLTRRGVRCARASNVRTFEARARVSLGATPLLLAIDEPEEPEEPAELEEPTEPGEPEELEELEGLPPLCAGVAVPGVGARVAPPEIVGVVG
jgi:hypothetical protein